MVCFAYRRRREPACELPSTRRHTYWPSRFSRRAATRYGHERGLINFGWLAYSRCTNANVLRLLQPLSHQPSVDVVDSESLRCIVSGSYSSRLLTVYSELRTLYAGLVLARSVYYLICLSICHVVVLQYYPQQLAKLRLA